MTQVWQQGSVTSKNRPHEFSCSTVTARIRTRLLYSGSGLPDRTTK